MASEDGGCSWQRLPVAGDGMVTSFAMDADGLVAGLGPSALLSYRDNTCKALIDWESLARQGIEGEYVRFVRVHEGRLYLGIEGVGLVDGDLRVLLAGEVRDLVVTANGRLVAIDDSGILTCEADRWTQRMPFAALSHLAMAQDGGIIALAARGLLESVDHGLTWYWLNREWSTEGVRTISALPAGRQVILAGGSSGIARSIDGGRSWLAIDAEVVDVSEGGLAWFEETDTTL